MTLPGRRFVPSRAPAAIIAGLSPVVPVALIYIGARGFRDFDSALIGYAVAVVLAFRPDISGITVAFLGCVFALGLGNGTVFDLVATYFPRETGTVTGLVGAAGGLGGFFPPLVMGAVGDLTGTYTIGFMLLSEFAMLALIVNLLALQRYARRLAPDDGV